MAQLCQDGDAGCRSRSRSPFRRLLPIPSVWIPSWTSLGVRLIPDLVWEGDRHLGIDGVLPAGVVSSFCTHSHFAGSKCPIGRVCFSDDGRSLGRTFTVGLFTPFLTQLCHRNASCSCKPLLLNKDKTKQAWCCGLVSWKCSGKGQRGCCRRHYYEWILKASRVISSLVRVPADPREASGSLWAPKRWKATLPRQL